MNVSGEKRRAIEARASRESAIVTRWLRSRPSVPVTPALLRELATWSARRRARGVAR